MPDVVLFACKPAGAMLLQEAANRAGVGSGAPALGRPTCMALPASLQHGAITSLGCIGNRVYTGLGEDEMYVVLRGRIWREVAEALKTIGSANVALQRLCEGAPGAALDAVEISKGVAFGIRQKLDENLRVQGNISSGGHTTAAANAIRSTHWRQKLERPDPRRDRRWP